MIVGIDNIVINFDAENNTIFLKCKSYPAAFDYLFPRTSRLQSDRPHACKTALDR